MRVYASYLCYGLVNVARLKNNSMYNSWKSAKNRSTFSRPAAICNGKKLIKGDRILDYGCGQGGDVFRWREMGYQAIGFDPYWSPELPGGGDCFSTVTCFYVLNVIPSVLERLDVLRRAWDYCSDRLIIANITGGATLISGDRYFVEFSTWDLKRLIIYSVRKIPQFIESGLYVVDRSFPDVRLYTWQKSVEAIDQIRSDQPIANDGDYLSSDRGRIVYYRGDGRRFTVKPKDLEIYKSAIERRDRIRDIQLCTF